MRTRIAIPIRRNSAGNGFSSVDWMSNGGADTHGGIVGVGYHVRHLPVQKSHRHCPDLRSARLGFLLAGRDRPFMSRLSGMIGCH